MDILRLEDILSAKDFIINKEQTDKNTLIGLQTISFENIKPKLVSWALQGFPNSHVIYEVEFIVPDTCSDGVKRNFSDYVKFLIEKSIDDYIKSLQSRFEGFSVAHSYNSKDLLLIISKN